MSHKGFSHVGLSTLDLDRTRDFYEEMLRFKVVSPTRSRSRKAEPSATSSLIPAAISCWPSWSHAIFWEFPQRSIGRWGKA